MTDLDSIAIMQGDADVARKAFLLKQKIRAFQDTFTVIEKVFDVKTEIKNHVYVCVS